MKKKFSIMKDKGPWKFDDELIMRIKQGDKMAVAEFYNANYSVFAGMAGNYVWKQRNLFGDYTYEFDDLIQQVYVDIPYYDYSSRLNLYFGIVKGSFCRVNTGGILSSQSKHIKATRIVSYDTPLINNNGKESNNTYVLDRLAHSSDVFEVIVGNEEREEKDKQICAFLERTIKNKRDLNAMWCKLFTDLPLSEIKGNEYECYKQRAI